ncbi:relaxase/mobilization nuclease domain-containing protein, partial [Halobacillus litoralis]
VHPEDGRKYHAHGKEAIDKVREESDRLCKGRGLSIAENIKAGVRYTQAEKGLIDREKFSWKDDIREKIDLEKQVSQTYEELKMSLKEKHNIDMKERGKNITFTHPDKNKKVRGSKLGNDYEKETLQREFEITKETRTDQPSQERGTATLSYEQGNPELSRIAEPYRGKSEVNGNSERLRQHANRQGHRLENDHSTRVERHQRDEPNRSAEDEFDFTSARETLERSRRETYKNYGNGRQPHESEQSKDHSKSESTPKRDRSATGEDRAKFQRENRESAPDHREQLKRDEEPDKQKLRRDRQQSKENDIER